MTEPVRETAWLRDWVCAELLPLWARHAPLENGLFRTCFDRTWLPTGAERVLLVAQARLIHNFCVGWRLTGDARYRDLAAHGVAALRRFFRDPRHGGWFCACTLDGDVADERKDCYHHAFTVFALAHAALALDDARARDEAWQTWELMRRRFADEHGGFRWHADRAFECTETERSQNPMMHSFEALLALAAAGGGTAALAEAANVWEFVAARRQADGTLPEVYGPVWRPLPVADGGRLDLGHACEWAQLLDRAVRLGMPGTLLADAHRFLEYGLRFGLDREHGGLASPAALDGAHLPGTRKGWWEQCEALRAMTLFARDHGRDDLVEPLLRTRDFFLREFRDGEHGGLYLQPPARLEKGTAYKVDYHLVALADALEV